MFITRRSRMLPPRDFPLVLRCEWRCDCSARKGLLGFFVEHQKDRRRSATAPEDLVHNILVLQQRVVDIFDRTELGMLLS